MKADIIQTLRATYADISPFLNERSRRIWAASAAKNLGRGGITLVQKVTGISSKTIRKGILELESDPVLPVDRCRKSGGGRKKITETQPQLIDALKAIVDPATRGDPQNPLLWTSKSLSKIVTALKKQGFQVGITSVRLLLKQLGYTLQSNRKRLEGSHHPDRDAQFEYVNKQIKKQLAKKQPVISVDSKKKENLGNYSNKGQEYQPKKQPVSTNTHDFPGKDNLHAIPYGVWEMKNNTGFVSIGITHNTAEFAVNTIRSWWKLFGMQRFPQATNLTITADSGGSNASNSRLWKLKLQELADEIQKDITVLHYPPGTSKWNKIEHRLFAYISKNWRGKPLVDMATVVNLIANTTTKSGLTVHCLEDKNNYKTAIKVTNKELKNINLKPHKFHSEWNYTIKYNKK
jgi:transposase